MSKHALRQASEGRLLQLAPHKSEMEFRRLLEKLPAGAYTCDPDGLITYFNRRRSRLSAS